MNELFVGATLQPSKKPKNRRLTKTEENQIIRMYQGDYLIKDISRSMNVNRKTISAVAKRRGIELRESSVTKQRPKEERAKAVKMLDSGMTVREVSAKTKIPMSTVNNWRSRYSSFDKEQSMLVEKTKHGKKTKHEILNKLWKPSKI